MIHEIRRTNRHGDFSHPIFQVRYYRSVLLMDPAGFREWMSQQKWPDTGGGLKFDSPEVLLPDAQSWDVVEFQIGRVYGGTTVIAHSGGKTLYDAEGNVINIVVPNDIGS